jgi:hypothetical protein
MIHGQKTIKLCNTNTLFCVLGWLWRSTPLSWWEARPLVCWWNCKLGNQVRTASFTWCVCICSKICSVDHAANGTVFKWWQGSALMKNKHHLFCTVLVNRMQEVKQFTIHSYCDYSVMIYNSSTTLLGKVGRAFVVDIRSFCDSLWKLNS